ncbi:MAG: hypothetical protein CMJ49_13060 [Planctomycetaceae bacterium]|nr:hypothetical protein [Planctomycetaceae bacterium]
MQDPLVIQLLISVLMFASVVMLVQFGARRAMALWWRFEERYDHVLNKQLLLSIAPRTAMVLTVIEVLGAGLILGVVLDGVFWFVIGAGLGLAVPHVLLRHLETKRRERLEDQLVDGITTMSAAVRAGLNLVQSIELIKQNHAAPMRQEFEELLKEYELGVDLNQALMNTSNRIGSSYYRLWFGAIAAHRERGGDVGESLDRIADSIREIQRLEGRLRALTAQGRNQAWMMALMPVVILLILYMIAPQDTSRLFSEPVGRLLLLAAAGLILIAITWIRRIMSVDI